MANKKENLFFVNLAKKFKEVREKIGLTQSELSEKVSKYVAEENFRTSNVKELSFTQSAISYIENSEGTSKERVFVLIKFYEKHYNINPGFFLSDNVYEPMYVYEKFLDISKRNKEKKKIEKIFEKYINEIPQLRDKIIKEIMDEL